MEDARLASRILDGFQFSGNGLARGFAGGNRRRLEEAKTGKEEG
jgi:hypothetical protein